MALSGLEIFKLLPKTNCGDCGVPTCMAFAMKLAQKKAELGECPHASDEASEVIGAAATPPMKSVKIGVGSSAIEVGSETVMFRHEKTFVNQTGIAVLLRSGADKEELLRAVRDIESYRAERVGEELGIDLFCISCDGEDGGGFLGTVEMVKENSSKGIILDCPDRELLKPALSLCKNDRPSMLLREEITDADIDLARENGASLIVSAESIDSLLGQIEKAREAGLSDIILNLDARNAGRRLQNNTILRRSALRQNFKPFGFPLFALIRAEDRNDLIARATTYICKYDSIIVLTAYDRAMLYTLLTLRQNIYTDPQKPIQVEPKIYAIGEPTPESPVFVTTNFSLTYFIVSGEIENSGISAHLVVCDCEGQSVLTAWAAGKFTGETIGKFVKEIDLERHVKTRRMVIPGFVSQISGDLEESLPGWEVIVGCQEASDIPSFVKSVTLT
jgi:acetyl-CoA decarbonylase/synthase complex subunit gamma